LIWEARRIRTTKAEVISRFKQKAYPIFSMLWQRLTPEQAEAMTCIMTDQSTSHLSAQAIDQLTWRGVLNAEGDIFCTSFAEFIHDELE
jgi:hypothetical protein